MKINKKYRYPRFVSIVVAPNKKTNKPLYMRYVYITVNNIYIYIYSMVW